jgi:cytochrome bd-type quinol oxidase subunit 2
MLNTLKNKLLIMMAVLTLSVPAIIPLQTASAANAPCNKIGKAINSGINATTGSNTTCGAPNQSLTNGVSSLAAKVVNLFSIIVGIVSVIMIIYAGFRYVTSGGESGSVSSAKNTLIYAIIGLVIVVLAQLIVHYVLNTATNVGAASTGGSY